MYMKLVFKTIKKEVGIHRINEFELPFCFYIIVIFLAVKYRTSTVYF